MFNRIAIFHGLSILTALLLAWILIYLFGEIFINSISPEPRTTIIIKGVQQKLSGVYPNLSAGDEAELEFAASLMNEKQLTVFGSSEFSSSPFCTYNFLPDSLGFQTLGIGHAHHQSLSILCELLAMNEYLENSKICIFISPGWFEVNGTNASAFLEFVRPNFLKRIIRDKGIEDEYKLAIGKFISDNDTIFTELSNEMDYLKKKFEYSSLELLQIKINDFGGNYPCGGVTYEIEPTFMEPKIWHGNLEKLSENAQAEFLTTTTGNEIFVYDDYYNQYLLYENGTPRKGEVKKMNINDNRELSDLKLLIRFLASRSADCSFVILPLNPYYYENISELKPMVEAVTAILDENKLPYLNMSVFNKEDYKAGTLKDIMHLGDVGWIRVNSFLTSNYYE